MISCQPHPTTPHHPLLFSYPNQQKETLNTENPNLPPTLISSVSSQLRKLQSQAEEQSDQVIECDWRSLTRCRSMDSNVCDVSHLDADVLLPPRKRLLAGFKRQNSDVDAAAASAAAASYQYHAPHPHPHPHPHPVVAVASSSSSASPSTPAPPSPTPYSPTSIEFQTRLNLLVSSHFNNSQNFTPEEIVEASKSAANVAAKAAEIARAAAQEKAMVASRAVAAAREALALVALFPEEGSGSKSLKKNKLKKHVQVQMLYKKHSPTESSGDDEEVARKLHRVINSSPRISKNSSSSDLKGHKDKKLKSSQNAERTTGYHGNVGFGGNPPSMGSHVAIAGELDYESSIQDASTSRGGEKGSKFEKSSPSRVGMSNGEAETSRSKEKTGGNASSPSKRRGRLRLKKLPLSICNIRDQANPKDDVIIPRGSPLADKNMENSPSPATRLKPLFPMEARGDKKVVPMEAAPPPIWKCQDFKAPACVKQNKVMQS